MTWAVPIYVPIPSRRAAILGANQLGAMPSGMRMPNDFGLRKRRTSKSACGADVDVIMAMKTGGSPDANVNSGNREPDPDKLPPRYRRVSVLEATAVKPYSIAKDPSWLPYCWAISIFLCSRVVVALGLVFSQKYLPIAIDVWSAGPLWYHQLLQWDSEWYFRIVTEGYRYNGDPTIQQNIVFYPLYPMLARGLVRGLSGLTPSDAMLLVSNVAGLSAIVVLFKLVREEFGDQLALATTALLSFFPTSVLLSAGYTEPLELLLIVSFFLALKRKHYLSAALLAGLAVADSINGHCPVACPSLGDVAQSRSEAVSSCSPAMRRCSRHRASGCS